MLPNSSSCFYPHMCFYSCPCHSVWVSPTGTPAIGLKANPDNSWSHFKTSCLITSAKHFCLLRPNSQIQGQDMDIHLQEAATHTQPIQNVQENNGKKSHVLFILMACHIWSLLRLKCIVLETRRRKESRKCWILETDLKASHRFFSLGI